MASKVKAKKRLTPKKKLEVLRFLTYVFTRAEKFGDEFDPQRVNFNHPINDLCKTSQDVANRMGLGSLI